LTEEAMPAVTISGHLTIFRYEFLIRERRITDWAQLGDYS
jgi:hypothetical protein